MTLPGYIPSYVALEEHRHSIARSTPNPDWPPAQPVATASCVNGARRWLSDTLRAIADRLEPAGSRASVTHLVVMSNLDDGR